MYSNAMFVTSRISIKRALLSYGEFEYAEKIKNLTNEQILEIGKMSMNYISDNTLIEKMISLASVEFFEGKKRPLIKN